jgi:hypothetical protein
LTPFLSSLSSSSVSSECLWRKSRPFSVAVYISFLLMSSLSIRWVFFMYSRYWLSCTKLRFALYMIWVLRVPCFAIARISASMLSLSLRLGVASVIHEFTSITFFQICFL